MIHGLIGQPLAWGILAGALGAVLWHHENHWQRLTAWCFAVAAACFTVAIPPLFDSLAALTTSGAGLTWLAVLSGVALTAFYLQAVRSHKRSLLGRLLGGKSGSPGKGLAVLTSPAPRPNRYRRIGTPVVAMLTGALLMVDIGAWRLLLKNAGTSAAGTLKDLATSSRAVNNGSAAAAIPPSHRPAVYIAAVAVLLVIVLVMRAHDKRKRGGKGQPQRGGIPGIPVRGNN